MKTHIILRLSFIVGLALVYSCKTDPAKVAAINKQINSVDNYLEAASVVKTVLGRDYSDPNFRLLDSISPIKGYFLDSFCLTMLLQDTSFPDQNIKAHLELQQQHPKVWTEVHGFRFKRFKNETLDSIKADTTGDVSKIEKMLGFGFWSISYPLFLNDGEYCLIGLDFTCGPLCGNSRVVLCKRQRDKWTVVKTYCQAVS